jgi:hypothetical protein
MIDGEFWQMRRKIQPENPAIGFVVAVVAWSVMCYDIEIIRIIR